MRQRAYEWDPRPPTNRERIICGIWLLAFVPAMANYYAGWGLFGGYDKWVFGALMLGSLFLFARLPGVRRNQGAKRPLGYWLILGLGLLGAVVLSVLSPSR